MGAVSYRMAGEDEGPRALPVEKEGARRGSPVWNYIACPKLHLVQYGIVGHLTRYYAHLINQQDIVLTTS